MQLRLLRTLLRIATSKATIVVPVWESRFVTLLTNNLEFSVTRSVMRVMWETDLYVGNHARQDSLTSAHSAKNQRRTDEELAMHSGTKRNARKRIPRVVIKASASSIQNVSKDFTRSVAASAVLTVQKVSQTQAQGAQNHRTVVARREICNVPRVWKRADYFVTRVARVVTVVQQRRVRSLVQWPNRFRVEPAAQRTSLVAHSQRPTWSSRRS